MTALIARKELLENATTYRFYILTGMLAVLMAISILVGYGDYELRLENYNLNRPKPHTSNVMIPPTPVSIFAKGVDAHIGRLHYITSMWIEVQDVEQSVNRLFSLFTVPDMLFIVRVMLSLIAILFSFDAVSGEKENGTLKLSLANGSSRSGILLGKLLGRFLLVFVPFLILFFASGIIVSVLPDVQSSGEYWLRLGSFAAISGVYAFVFTALGIFLSSLVHRSPTALVLSCAVWVLFVFVIPQTGMTLARGVSDLPPGDRIEMEHRLANVRAIYERIHAQESTQGSPSGTRMVEQIRDANGALSDSYRPRLNALIRLGKTLARVSPAGALTFVMTDAAATGVYEELRFKDAVALFAHRNFEYINDLRKGEMEDFQYTRSSLGETLSGDAFVDLVVLMIFALVFVGLSMVSLLRYDPR